MSERYELSRCEHRLISYRNYELNNIFGNINIINSFESEFNTSNFALRIIDSFQNVITALSISYVNRISLNRTEQKTSCYLNIPAYLYTHLIFFFIYSTR